MFKIKKECLIAESYDVVFINLIEKYIIVDKNSDKKVDFIESFIFSFGCI
jgi:hypothetical protein